MKKSKGKKIAIGLVVGVLATTAIICAVVPQVRESITELISKIKGEQTPEEKEKQDKEKAQEKAHDDDYYQDLTDDEKEDFDKKLDELVDSDHYKNLDDEEKDKLLDKFVESEKTVKEVSQDPKDKKPEEIEIPAIPTKEQGATDEEIAEAEKKAEEAKQEKTYWETVETVKESVSSNGSFEARNPGKTIRRINGIYVYEGNICIDADFIQEEIIDGRSYFSQLNQFCRFSKLATGKETYEEILQMFTNETVIISVDKTFLSKNTKEQKDYFSNNKSSMDNIFNILERNNYSLSIVESWQTNEYDFPEFIINAKSENDEMMYMATYSPELEEYRVQPIQKICPEFWAQLEIERSQTAKNSAEAQTQAIIDEFSTFDENGEMTGFDWNAYRALKEQQEAKDQEKISSQNADQKVELSYSEKELGF